MRNKYYRNVKCYYCEKISKCIKYNLHHGILVCIKCDKEQ